ncbi:hypothetical protein JYT11_00850 [Planctomycetaceae bacterium AH-315-I19]|nr:hypothetical protein [Planctomycetaceae bacterium AH-315-I19]
MSTQHDRHTVDPGRLALGTWDTAKNKHTGEGDIAASYSGDRIGLGEPIRKPFVFNGSRWVCVLLRGTSESLVARAYRLVHLSQFDGTPMAYQEKTRDVEAARRDPCGFYHDITVAHAGDRFVLVGPPIVLVAGEWVQQKLFGRSVRGQSRER